MKQEAAFQGDPRILTGTPGGIGPMVSGDEVEVQIDGLESLHSIAE